MLMCTCGTMLLDTECQDPQCHCLKRPVALSLGYPESIFGRMRGGRIAGTKQSLRFNQKGRCARPAKLHPGALGNRAVRRDDRIVVAAFQKARMSKQRMVPLDDHRQPAALAVPDVPGNQR